MLPSPNIPMIPIAVEQKVIDIYDVKEMVGKRTHQNSQNRYICCNNAQLTGEKFFRKMPIDDGARGKGLTQKNIHVEN